MGIAETGVTVLVVLAVLIAAMLLFSAAPSELVLETYAPPINDAYYTTDSEVLNACCIRSMIAEGGCQEIDIYVNSHSLWVLCKTEPGVWAGLKYTLPLDWTLRGTDQPVNPGEVAEVEFRIETSLAWRDYFIANGYVNSRIPEMLELLRGLYSAF